MLSSSNGPQQAMLSDPVRSLLHKEHEFCRQVVELGGTLVTTSTQGGIDDVAPLLAICRNWSIAKGMKCHDVIVGGACRGLVLELVMARPGPHLCLNACVDTAPIGDLAQWRFSPTSGVIADGRLLGRGAADSKLAAALFMHIADHLIAHRDQLCGKLTVFLDGDEHAGEFGAAQEFVRMFPDTTAAYIGYPGERNVCVGARGFFRAEVTVEGVAAHSGASEMRGTNAILKAASLVSAMESAFQSLENLRTHDFPLGPRLTVTSIAGGDGFSMVPGLCKIGFDIRTTPCFSRRDAEVFLRRTIEVEGSGVRDIFIHPGWEAYVLGEGSRAASTLLSAAREHVSIDVAPKVCGPSNIGNLLAGFNVEATCGFGTDAQQVHGANESADVTRLPQIARAYVSAVCSFLSDSLR